MLDSATGRPIIIFSSNLDATRLGVSPSLSLAFTPGVGDDELSRDLCVPVLDRKG